MPEPLSPATLFGSAILMCYALFGEGHFAVANAMHYGEACLSAPARVAVALAGLLAWPPLLLLCGRYWVPRPRGKARHVPLLLHATLAVHAALSAVDGAHTVPLLLLLVAQFCTVRHDVTDALGAVVVVLPLGFATAVYGAATGVHDNRREMSCDTALSVGSLLLGGALYAHPVTALWLVLGPSLETGPAFVAALAAHAALVVCLCGGLVWVPTLLESAYVDMLVGGVSGHETWALVAQIALLSLSAVAHAWLLVRLSAGAHGAPLERVLAAEPYFLTVFAIVGTALFLRNFDLLVLVCVQGAVLGTTLVCHYASSPPTAAVDL